jgi:hypothetical protein
MAILLFLLALLLAGPALVQDFPAAPDIGGYVGSLAATAGTVVLLTQFVVSGLGLNKFVAQLTSWLVTTAVVAASAYFDVGYLAAASTYVTIANGIAVALVANRLADAGTLDRFLEALKLKPPKK